MNKTLKILLYVLGGILSLIILLFIIIAITTIHESWPDNYKCWKGGGSWEGYPDGCHDECYYLSNPRICTEAFSVGCDCGPDKCWNGNKCIPNSEALGSE